MTRAYAVAPNEGSPTWMMNALMTFKARGADTEGAFALFEFRADRNAEPPPHIHHGEDEAWYVLEGSVTFHVGGRAFEAPTGTFVYGPRGVPHHLTITSPEARVLTIVSPAGFEGFFEEVGEPEAALELPSPAAPDVERVMRAAARYRCEILGAPQR